MNKFLVFVHIEKNGGITLHRILHNSYRGYVTPRPNYGLKFSSYDLKKLQSCYPIGITGIGGHRIVPAENYNNDQFLFTFLRNPVDRYMSHLNYQISRMEIEWNIEQFIEDPYFSNFQCYRISGTRDLNKSIDVINDRFSFVGLMEEYDRSLIILSNMLKDPLLRRNYEKRNVSGLMDKSYNFQTLDKKYRSKIIENNKADLALYEHVKNNIFTNYDKIGFDSRKILPNNYIKEKMLDLKRKVSTFYIGRIIQPTILRQRKTQRGY